MSQRARDLQKKIDLISSDENPDLEFLEEQAKILLGYAKTKDSVVFI